MLNICLFEPEIPQNTGNIARTCAATGARLHLVHPLGFSISEKAVRHAGLDYWKDVTIIEYKSVDEFMTLHKDDTIYFLSTKGRRIYSEEDFASKDDIYLCFGKESKGIDEKILKEHPEQTIRIPMVGEIRSLNLSNSVAIVLYEVLRQQGFKDFKREGELHNLKWED